MSAQKVRSIQRKLRRAIYMDLVVAAMVAIGVSGSMIGFVSM